MKPLENFSFQNCSCKMKSLCRVVSAKNVSCSTTQKFRSLPISHRDQTAVTYNEVQYFRGRVPNFNQSEARKHCLLASDWLRNFRLSWLRIKE